MTKICKVDGCAKKVFARAMCSMHYYRVLKTGTLFARRIAKKGELAAWVKEHADHNGQECLFWPFGSPRNGYGQVRVDGVDMSASRFMCIVAHGEPPSPGLHAAHSCGNGHRGCVNPSHLRWLTASQNAAEKIEHGTHQRGQRNPLAKLDEEKVKNIRDREHEGASALAREFGVHPNTVRDAIQKKTWAWL